MEAMNRHFAIVGPKLAEKITSRPDDDCLWYITHESNVMTFKTINETHMHNSIKNLKNGKAAVQMRVNKLSPNPSKTEYMIIGHPMKAKCANAMTGLELGSKEIK